MSAEMRLRDLARTVCQLLDCNYTCLCLYCPDETLRHPLLSLLFALSPSLPLYYGTLQNSTLLYDERLWMLCDQALLTGQCMLENAWVYQTSKEKKTIGSIMIALLERPAGILGFLFCTSRQTDAFREGEQRLLMQYIPELVWQVEQIVSESCLATSPAITSENIATGMQEQSAFLSLISHELRAPLTAIKGYAGLLQEYGLTSAMNEVTLMRMSDAQQSRYLAIIMEQVDHLEVLIGDVLDVSHIQSGHLALRCTYVDLVQLCQHVVQLMQWRIDKQQPGHYYILCTMDQEIPLVWADADRVQQVLTNLVENALKYSPAGGLIEIQVRTSSNCARNCTCIYHSSKYINPAAFPSPHATFVYVAVSDQGIGIPRQQQSSLFKPFTRLTHPATQHVSGSGLGLYIARKLVEAMHGRVLLHSSEGEGTTIAFTLPIAQTAGVSLQAPSAASPKVQTVPTR